MIQLELIRHYGPVVWVVVNTVISNSLCSFEPHTRTPHTHTHTHTHNTTHTHTHTHTHTGPAKVYTHCTHKCQVRGKKTMTMIPKRQQIGYDRVYASIYSIF